MKTFDKVWLSTAAVVALGSLVVLGNILEKTDGHTDAPAATKVDSLQEQCDAMLLKNHDPIFTELRVLSTWWKDGQKIYLYEITFKDGEQLNRLCIVDRAKGILFSPSVLNQTQFLK